MPTKKHQPSQIVSMIAKSHLDKGDALGWFEAVYQTHRDEPGAIPWADFAPNDLLVSWVAREEPDGAQGSPITPPHEVRLGGLSSRACVVGCGLGDDAAELARRGFDVTAFDLSPTAIDLARARFAPGSTGKGSIEFETANLLALPEAWHRAFDLVFEAYTLQSLPASIRRQAFENIAGVLAPGGRLVVVARLREPSDPIPDGPPWPLTRTELVDHPPGRLAVEREEVHEPSDKHPSRRIRVTYRFGGMGARS